MNEQLRKQTATLQAKVATAASKSQSYKKSSKANAPPGEFGDDASSGLLSALEAEKRALMNQLFDIELRIEQEAKAYHKANEERKAVQQNASSVSAQLNALRLSVQPADAANFSADLVNRESAYQGKRHGISLKNIPPDQRVIDPKRGPIKRTAAVKQLPPLT
uniref:CCDC92 domain-containing protein n=1 Tax=Macrostomum lignano TaxID=282301 RepID=A0A1I8GB43_9PLAT